MSLPPQEIGFFDQTRTGELVNRLASDTGVIQATMATNMSLLLRNIATSTFALLMIFLLSWRLTLVMLAAVPPISIGAVSCAPLSVVFFFFLFACTVLLWCDDISPSSLIALSPLLFFFFFFLPPSRRV